ncbi:MAG: hypothetical protein WCO00_05800 [Rhodospirillaceae bacterium]
MADNLTITTANSSLTVADGTHSRTANYATVTGAKAMAARFENDPELARKWMMTEAKPPAAPRLHPVSIRRIDRTVIIYADTGRPIRSCLCPSVQDAVTLEAKLASDLDFAIWWVMGDRRQVSSSRSRPRG